jgi:CheY-like chemotaxis protein/HPt (histidine-containing phosphotransfer) domain-containing protein
MPLPQEFHHIREKFRSEVEQHLTDAGNIVRTMDVTHGGNLDRIARHLHAIKGSAPIVGARPVSNVARVAEESIHLVHEQPALWNGERMSLILEAFEFMRRQVQEFVDGQAIEDGEAITENLRKRFPGAEEAAKRVKAVGASQTVPHTPKKSEPLPEGKLKLLFVDDSQIARELYKVFFANRGFEVKTAGDGEEALQLLRSEAFHIVVTDDQMPEMDGTELLRISRSEEPLSAIPFIVISGKANEEAKTKALEWGAAAYLVKGDFEKEHLVEVIARVLNHSR